MENQQLTKEGSKKGRREQGNYKVAKKQLMRWHSVSSYPSIITLNLNRLNSPTKDTEWLDKFKKWPNYILPTRDSLALRTHRSKWRIGKRYSIQKRSRVAILISDKIDFTLKAVTRDKEGHYITIKRSDDITVVNIYTTNIGTSKRIKQIVNISKGRNR